MHVYDLTLAQAAEQMGIPPDALVHILQRIVAALDANAMPADILEALTMATIKPKELFERHPGSSMETPPLMEEERDKRKEKGKSTFNSRTDDIIRFAEHYENKARGL